MRAPLAVWAAFVLSAMMASAGLVFLDSGLGVTAKDNPYPIWKGQMGLSDPADPQRAADAVPALITALKDPDPGLRSAAARTLGEIGPQAKAALPALTQALADSNEDVLQEVTNAVRSIKAPPPRSIQAID